MDAVNDTRRRILDAVDEAFDRQLETTKQFSSIPSTRGAEGPCQDMMGDLLRARGYEVDDWHIDVENLKELRGLRPHRARFLPRPHGGGNVSPPRARRDAR